MIMSSYFNVFAPKNDKDLCWYRPKPHFVRGVSKLLEGSVYILFPRGKWSHTYSVSLWETLNIINVFTVINVFNAPL